MPEALRVHSAAIEHKLPQGSEPRFSEEGAGSAVCNTYLSKAAVQHGLHRGRDLRLVPSLPATPGAQEDAVRDPRVLAEVAAQLATEQNALSGGKRDLTFGSIASWLVLLGARPAIMLPVPGAVSRDPDGAKTSSRA